MIRIRRTVESRQMTGCAVCREARINIALVAGRALHAAMRTCQGKRGRGVIERCARPGSRIVAGCTLLRESGLRMVRVRRAAVIRQMTGRTRCREACINIVFVARRTLHA